MSDPFRSARLKINRAKHHIGDLDGLITQFRAGVNHAHEIVVEEDAQTGYKLHKLRLPKLPLEDFSILTGDAVSNTRAALDHIIYACAVANGHVKPKLRTCNFPFGSNATAYALQVKGCTSVPEQIRALLSSFQAYEGGNTPLWALNATCNWDKHALITPILVGFDDYRMNATGVVKVPTVATWKSTEHHIEMDLFWANTDATCDFTFSPEIAFDSPPYLAGHRVVPVLNYFVDIVEHVLVAIEAECRILFPDKFR